jgi:ribonuclease D
MYIRTVAPLRRLCEQAKAEGRLALDVEFIREHSYVPKLALIQMAVSDTCAIIDPLAVTDLSPLFDLVAAPQTLKILHAAGQDLEVLFWHSARPPVHIFDTQVVAAIVGLGEQLSYGSLVERLLGTTLTKGESYSDWLRRPLSLEQLEYALNDVRYLLDLYTLLVRRLEEMGRTAWAKEECQPFENLERYQRNPRTLFRRVRRGHTLPPQGQAILRELAAWREQEAQERDRPPGSVLRDEQLVDIARKAPRTLSDLQRFRSLSPRLIERSGVAILSAVQRGLEVAESERPLPLRSRRPTHTEKLMVKFLDTCLKALCAREKLPASFIASRSDLEDLVHRHRQGDVHATGSPILEGWRGALVGQELLAALAGHASLSLNPKTGEVTFASTDGKHARVLPLPPKTAL